MRFIRSLLLLIYFVLFTVPYATACFIAFPFMRADNRYWMAAGWCRATLHTVRWLNGIRYNIRALRTCPMVRPCCCPSINRPGKRWRFRR